MKNKKNEIMLKLAESMIEFAPENDKEYLKMQSRLTLNAISISDKVKHLLCPFGDLSEIDDQDVQKKHDIFKQERDSNYPWDRVAAFLENILVEIDAFTASMIEEGYLKEDGDDE